LSSRWGKCISKLALLSSGLLACASSGGPEQRIEALVYDRFARLDAADPDVEYRVGPIRIAPTREGLYEARFELDRLATDEAGIPHIARRAQTWLVRERSDGTAEILSVDEQELLAFPGTGPQIVCY
jgi:hypothetical protein